MRRRDFYLLLVAVFTLGVYGVVVAPEATLVVLVAFLPVVLVAGAIAVGYLARVYRAQPVPRSRFFGMLIETFTALVCLGLWVGYLSAARLLERSDIGLRIPAPAPAVSSPISALIVLVVFAAPVRFALEVYLIRRRSSPPRSAQDASDLDRRDDE